MKASLRIATSSKAGKLVPLRPGTHLIGRGRDASLRARSDLVSRRHCELIVDAESVTVRDLGSKNGTWVNGQQIDAPRKLAPGDTLQVGPMRFEVVIGEAPSAAAGAADKEKQEKAVAQQVDSTDTAAAGAESAAVSPQVTTGGDAVEEDYDADISDWLDDEDLNEDTPPAVSETAPAATSDTDVPAVDETRAVERPTGGADRSTATPASGQGKPGKLPPRPAEPTQDSGQAAADVLRNLSKRR